ncbi:RHS repeat-associated core domain-containing protein [Kitasatospora sp. NPDC098663]|uniref:RHS repeat-associated core domain-containing protein n=1 Tax=Kitasatospora sp. NPDC098663 TaxID=3364096 RepID=UPI00382B3527
MASAPGCNSKWGASTWSAADSANASTLTWDVEGKLASLAQGSAVTTYVYDADGNQLIRRNPGKVTVNLGGGDELTYDTGTKTSTGTRYYSIPGGITLVRESPTKLTYQFADHHGTNTLSIGRDSLAETRRPTDPFGAPRGTTSSTTAWAGDKGYVGGLKDDATGFTNLGARQYQPTTGRFLSADPLLLPADPQQWNAYVYSNNDPVNKTDPTGMALEECASGMAKCSNMGTKIEGEGENYQKIVAQIQAQAGARRDGYERFLQHQSMAKTSKWVGAAPSTEEMEKSMRQMRRATGLELEKDYLAKSPYPTSLQEGQSTIKIGKVNTAEVDVCAALNAITCLDAWGIKDWSEEMVAKEYPGIGDRDDRVNSFRHLMWQARLSYEQGAENAEHWAIAHEAFGPQPDLSDYNYRDHLSDLVNNARGRNIGVEASRYGNGHSRDQAMQYILEAVRADIRNGLYARRDDFLPQ